MYGDLGNKLIIEAKRTQQLQSRRNGIRDGTANVSIPQYNDALVRGIIAEVEQIRESGAGGDAAAGQCAHFVNLLCLERNKRCLLSYHKMRSEIMDGMAWAGTAGDVLSGGGGATDSTLSDQLGNLSHSEQSYLQQYTDLLTQMKSAPAFADIDLAGSLTPPSDIFIDVRVLKDAGEIQTEYGTFNLVKDSQFYVRQSDVESLIQQGYLQKI
ncbi:DNA replication protein PSF1 KNAG_0H01450 [Huiozyma naganishii CBS 8797]|uniref:DNA replication complex GINS protein PSF1 n=1 Tax=Huiozyma naganishii (strain ATCC MYA-139 / BCRC 22969 / CBS 8797 / KCTC 17520 / NBRC 10181 / NCYC 3082 / Yp74L-3) TaxID=1071383 RepID=J7RPE7_HUIN7|nr:hypothetical protein KNAG_0H01450 [Kazachstania naganishii CBS 8797]CCK71558.1 hypothetical protein KNAG_0H01450 [Kazachstania naganishii CBS 8797]